MTTYSFWWVGVGGDGGRAPLAQSPFVLPADVITKKTHPSRILSFDSFKWGAINLAG